MRLLNDKGRPFEQIEQFQSVIFQLRIRCIGPPIRGHVSVGFETMEGQRIFATTTKLCGLRPVEFTGERIIELVIPSIPVVGGIYRARARVGDEHAMTVIHELNSEPFQIESDRPEVGMVWMKHLWRFPGPSI